MAKNRCFPALAHSLLYASWRGRAAITLDNAEPRTTFLNACYAKPLEQGVVTDGNA